MVYRTLSDAYRDFMAGHGCSACNRIHWDPNTLDRWLRTRTSWNGTWNFLTPALVESAAAASRIDPCPRTPSRGR